MGPLHGYTVLELGGIGPGPFACMMCADMGADVVSITRLGRVATAPAATNVLRRGRRSIGLDLRSPAGQATVLRLVERCDAMVEGFRPGVAERLGIGPAACLERNPRLVYGRVTGWGRTGPYAAMAGHDLNYVALSGTLWMIGQAGGSPVLPLNLLGDFGGGLLLAFGLVSALLETSRSGQGQVVDTAMTDASALLAAAIHGLRQGGGWPGERGENMLDGGAFFYGVYETADGKYVAFGAIEERFFTEMSDRLGLEVDPADRMDRARWPALKEQMAAIVRTRTRAEWCELFEGTDACFAPVLSPDEAPQHPHNAARGTFITVAGVTQPAPAPQFSRTPPGISRPPRVSGEDTDEVLAAFGFDDNEIAELRRTGAVA